MKPLISIGAAATLVFTLCACGNSKTDEATPADSTSSATVSQTPSTSPSGDAAAEESYNLRFRGHVDLQGKKRTSDANGNCHGTGPNQDLRQGAPVVIFDQLGAQVATATLMRGTVMPLGDDGPQACRFAFRTDKVTAVGYDYTAKVGTRPPTKFVIDDAMDISLPIR